MEVNRKEPEKKQDPKQTSGHKKSLGPWVKRPGGYMRPFGGRRGA